MPGEISKESFGFLQQIEESLNAGHGDGVGTMILAGILENHCGHELYLPRATERMRQKRDSKIRAMFKGDYLALEERLKTLGINLGSRQLRRIVG